MEAINAKCQVFTPQNIVIEVLNQIGYTNDLYGKKVMENSCGDGGFLIEIVKRYIQDCLNNNYSEKTIRIGLQRDIYGAEIDSIHREKCIENLNAIIQKYDIKAVNWNIIEGDILKENVKEKFQYIIGNPPYITYSELDIETRNFIREKFNACSKGKPDYYYAFIELSVNSLDVDGKLAYLIPNNIFKNRFAENLRTFILPFLSEISDYTTAKLFEDKLTSSAVIICDGRACTTKIKYIDKVNKRIFKIDKNKLSDKWIFNQDRREEVLEIQKVKFGNDFTAMCTIATLLNGVYILKDYSEDADFIFVNNHKIEKKILREAVSPRSKQYQRKEYIIFPYYYNAKGKLERYSEEEFEEKFPETTKYLKSNLDRLNRRDKDKNAKWFEFGRSQALHHINCSKLLISTLVTDKVRTHLLTKEQIPYSGIYIIPKNGSTLCDAEKILSSQEFFEYVQDIGINASGTTMRITAKDIDNFQYSL